MSNKSNKFNDYNRALRAVGQLAELLTLVDMINSEFLSDSDIKPRIRSLVRLALRRISTHFEPLPF